MVWPRYRCVLVGTQGSQVHPLRDSQTTHHLSHREGGQPLWEGENIILETSSSVGGWCDPLNLGVHTDLGKTMKMKQFCSSFLPCAKRPYTAKSISRPQCCRGLGCNLCWDLYCEESSISTKIRNNRRAKRRLYELYAATHLRPTPKERDVLYQDVHHDRSG